MTEENQDKFERDESGTKEGQDQGRKEGLFPSVTHSELMSAPSDFQHLFRSPTVGGAETTETTEETTKNSQKHNVPKAEPEHNSSTSPELIDLTKATFPAGVLTNMVPVMVTNVEGKAQLILVPVLDHGIGQTVSFNQAVKPKSSVTIKPMESESSNEGHFQNTIPTVETPHIKTINAPTLGETQSLVAPSDFLHIFHEPSKIPEVEPKTVQTLESAPKLTSSVKRESSGSTVSESGSDSPTSSDNEKLVKAASKSGRQTAAIADALAAKPKSPTLSEKPKGFEINSQVSSRNSSESMTPKKPGRVPSVSAQLTQKSTETARRVAEIAHALSEKPKSRTRTSKTLASTTKSAVETVKRVAKPSKSTVLNAKRPVTEGRKISSKTGPTAMGRMGSKEYIKHMASVTLNKARFVDPWENMPYPEYVPTDTRRTQLTAGIGKELPKSAQSQSKIESKQEVDDDDDASYNIFD